MAPKKNVETPSKAAKKTPEKTPKKRIKKETPKLNIPTVIKFKLPPIKSFANPVSLTNKLQPKGRSSSPQLTAAQKRKIGMAARKIELANEVALVQLVKPLATPTHLWECEPPPPPKAKPRKKLGRPKKRASADPTDPGVPVSAKSPKKKTPNKTKHAKNVAINKIYVPKRKADSTSKQPVQPKYSTNVVKPRGQSTQIKRSSRRRAMILEDAAIVSESPSILDPKGVATESPTFKAVGSTVGCGKASIASSEGPSWTKDISSSSATTCITVQSSNEFVRFDNKMPVVRIPNLEHFKLPVVEKSELSVSDTVGETTVCTSDSSSSSSDEESGCNSLKLSTSSVSPDKATDDVDKFRDAMERLDSILKNLDFEGIVWDEYDESNISDAEKKMHGKIFSALKEENEILRQCKELKRIFADENAVFDYPYDSDKAVMDVVEPIEAQITDKSEDDAFLSANGRDVMLQCYSKNNSFTEDLIPQVPAIPNEEEFGSDDAQDDDDVLSISADSYMESSLFDVTSTPAHQAVERLEEYVPEPISTYRKPNKIVYNPTQIAEEPTEPLVVTKTVCEKQNADSTSINKEIEQCLVTNDVERVDQRLVTTGLEVVKTNLAGSVPQKPFMLESQYKPVSAVKSAVFKGVCFFNLVSTCRRNAGQCKFPHMSMSVPDVTFRLQRLTNEMFIKEYLQARIWVVLRRLYGRCFAFECKRRLLTRVLVEMALDFNVSANETALRLAVSEIALLHLNGVDLCECEDLLRQPVGTRQLCDVFISVLGETQNLSRFKRVFVKLVAFIVQNGGRFDPEVAFHLLERVSILPYESSLARALLSVAENTHPEIFKHPSMVHFEKQVSKDGGMLKEFLAKKLLVLSKDVEPLNVEGVREKAMSDMERYSSPDTTKLDNMNKPADELRQPRALPQRFAPSFSTSSASSDTRPALNPKFRHWRPPPAGYKRPAANYLNGPSPAKFMRKSGNEYYN